MSMVQRRVCGLRSPAGPRPTTHCRTSGTGYILTMLQMTQGCRMRGLRSPRLAPDGAKGSSKRSRHVAKMLVRSGLRCHCCFKLKHECEHRKAAILHANYRTFSCKSLLSLGPLLGFLFWSGSPGPGPWWLNLEPPYSRHSILATPGIFGHGYTCVRCEAGTGKVVSTPGGSPPPPPAFYQCV